MQYRTGILNCLVGVGIFAAETLTRGTMQDERSDIAQPPNRAHGKSQPKKSYEEPKMLKTQILNDMLTAESYPLRCPVRRIAISDRVPHARNPGRLGGLRSFRPIEGI